jgi:hypothetical protein
MNSSKYSRSSNIEIERKYTPFWKRGDVSVSHFSRSNIPISQFLEENDKKSNFIDFANIDLKNITQENFDNIIENIISSLDIIEKEKNDKNKNEISFSREAIINLMKHGLEYHKSAPIINLLIRLSNSSEYLKKNDGWDYDDLIIFF